MINSAVACEICGYPPQIYVGKDRYSDPTQRRCTGHAKELCSDIDTAQRVCPLLRGNFSEHDVHVSPCAGCDPYTRNRRPLIYYNDDEHSRDRHVTAWRVIKVDGCYVWARAKRYDPKSSRLVNTACVVVGAFA